MLQDVRFALRQFNTHRGYAATAVLTMALGIGANTAVFSIADSVLFRPLAYRDADRLFVLRVADVTTGQSFGRMPDEAADAALATGLFDASARGAMFSERVYVRAASGLESLDLGLVPPAYVDLLGIQPAIGRLFTAADASRRPVLLSYRTWMLRYGGDPAVVGSAIDTPTGGPLHVVGILPPRFRNLLISGDDGMMMLEGRFDGAPPLLRLKHGVSLAAAQAQMHAMQAPGLTPGKTGLRLIPVREELAARQEPVLWLLLAAAVVVLLVACVNLANLMLARGAARERELATRAALGGSRVALMRLLVVESACLSVFGTVAGLFVAYLSFTVLTTRLPPLLGRAVVPEFDVRALVFAIVVACVSCGAFAMLPAWRLSRHVDKVARDGLRLGRTHTARRRTGRQVLVAFEVAICVALVVGASLVGRSLLALVTRELGFEPHRVVARFDMPTMFVTDGRSTRPDIPARIAFVQERLRELRALPGVRAAGAASALPFGGSAANAPLFEDRKVPSGVFNASAGFMGAMGIHFVAGRDFTDAESFADAPVGILNATAARTICGGDCLGRVVRAPRQPARTIVGVVADVRQSLAKEPVAAMYVPFDRQRFFFSGIVVDADDSPANREALKRTLSGARDVRTEVVSLAAGREREVSPYRFNALVVGAFAALTLALALVGVFGVMAAIVGERTREYCIRLALGATRERVKGLALRQAAIPIAAGVAIGWLIAAWGSGLMASLLFGVAPRDPLSFLLAPVLVLAAGLAAALIPASRAGAVDPIVALRAE